MADVLILYPPFTQPTIVYPGHYVVGNALSTGGYSTDVVDANVRFFEYLEGLIADPKRTPAGTLLRLEMERIQGLQRVLSDRKSFQGLAEGFFNRSRSRQTYYDHPTYSSMTKALNEALWLFGRVCGYKNLHIDNFETDANLDEVDNFLVFLNSLSRSPLAEYYHQMIDSLDFEPEGVVCVSAAFRTQLIPALLLGKLVREHRPDQLMILGGAAVTCLRSEKELFPQFFDQFDVVCFGQNLEPLLRFVQKWFAGTVVQGPASRDYVLCSSRTRTSVAERRSFRSEGSWINSLAHYITRNITGTKFCDPAPVIPLPAARGCYWNKCTFCFEYGNDSRGLVSSAGDVVQAMEDCLSTGYFRFFIGEGAVPPQLAHELGDLIRKKALPVEWYGFFRLEKNMTSEVVDAMSGAGGARLALFGLESGSQKIQNDMKKGVLIDRASAILRQSAAAGLWNHVLLMYGYPTETRADADETYEYLQRHKESIHSVASAVFTLDKASKLYMDGSAAAYGYQLSDRNRAGIDYFVRTQRRTEHDPYEYRARTLRYGYENLRMKRISSLMHGHELWFHRAMTN